MPRFFFNATGGQTYQESNVQLAISDYSAGSNSFDPFSGNRKALVMFDSTNIRAQLANMVPTACYVSYYVTGTFFFAATVTFGTHNHTTIPSTYVPGRVNPRRVARANTNVGQVTEMSLGATIGTEFKDGVSTGLALGPGPDSNTAYYFSIAPAADARRPVLIIDATIDQVPPSPPTLNEPASGAVVDAFGGGVSFRFTHVDINLNAMQAFAFRRRSATGVYEWWNGTAWALSTATLPASALIGGYLQIPPAKWTNGRIDTWAVATQDNTSLWGDYSSERLIYTSTPPTVTITDPVAQPTVPRPLVKWTYTDANGDAQRFWAVQVVTPDVYNDPTWNPENYLRQTWSQTANNADVAAQIGVDLTNHRTYRVYMKVGSSPNPPGGIQYSAWTYKQFETVVSPYAPAILYPENGSILDLAAGFTMSWRNNFYSGVGTLAGFALRRLQTGVYKWWNGTSWITTETFLAGTNPQYAFRVNENTNGVEYTYSIAIRDDYGQVSPYSNGATVVGTTAATVTVTQPVGVANVSNPSISWSMYDLENDPQQTYQVKVIHSSQFLGVVGFNAGTATSVYDTGEIASSGTRGVPLPLDLDTDNDYRAYVRVKTGGVYSGWSYSNFRVSLVAPATPMISDVTVSNDDGYVDVTIQARDSMLEEATARNFTGWIAQNNSTVTNAIIYNSAASKLATGVSSFAAGTMTTRTQNKYPITPGNKYTAAASIIAAIGASPVNTYVSIEWLDANSVTIAVSSDQPALDESAIRSSITAIAPALATDARVRVTFQNVAAPGQLHGVFNPVLRAGDGTEWSPGGTLGDTFVTIYEINSGRILRYGENIPVPTDSQTILVRDEEMPMGRPMRYRVVTRAIYGNAQLTSVADLSEETVWTSGYLWLSDPVRPASQRKFGPRSLGPIVRPVPQGKFRPLGRPDAIIVSGTRGLAEGDFTLITHTRQEREDFYDLLYNSEVLLLRYPPDQGDTIGETFYVKAEGDAPEERPLSSRTSHRAITQKWSEQFRPDAIPLTYEETVAMTGVGITTEEIEDIIAAYVAANPAPTGPSGPTGPQGPPGAAGAAGPQGQDGTRWYYGAGAPPVGGVPGARGGIDLYLDTTNQDIYQL